MITVTSLDIPCLCGSGKKLWKCCYGTTGLHKSPSLTAPKPPVTGISNSRCYANKFGDCERNLSWEHPTSEGILEIFRRAGRLHVGTETAIYIDTVPNFKTPKSQAKKILCTRHNSYLNHVDKRMIELYEFFEVMNKYVDPVNKNDSGFHAHLMSG